MSEIFDVAIIGAGVVGSAIARELAQYELAVVLIDASDDVGNATSKANTAILHTGFDMVPGSLESTLVRQGYFLLKEYAGKVGIATEPVGALLVAWSDEELANLPEIQEKAQANGYSACKIISSSEVYQLEPHLGLGALGALTVPDEWIIDPWSTTVAYATQAKRAGVQVRLNTKVTKVSHQNDLHSLATTSGDISTRFVVNVAGLYSDEIDAMFGCNDFTITPRKGELLVFDKLARSLISHIILPVPSSMGKGVLVSPTVFGNIMLGPTAENIEDKSDTSTTQKGIEFLKAKGAKIAPTLFSEEITTMYAGLRAASEHSDYQIFLREDKKLVTVGGIRSTGLTASMAIAQYVRELLHKAGLSLGKQSVLPLVVMPNLGEAGLRPYQDESLIEKDDTYGEIICHCERVTRGEIRDALASDLPATTLGGLGRRTRAGLGRCQGFYCHAQLRTLLAGEK
ncbi:MAG: FAD/NAD(P)-binding oxidoreductase [Streptomycetaceae bacterium]|nr:MAG: FAD/NAD(P)-binding oxidoreductase [Streptomycetaceae bacterium]